MDAYPTDDAETDALHPFGKADEQTADEERQIDYEDFQRALMRRPTERVLYELGAALIGYLGPQLTRVIHEYATKYGWRLTLRAVADCLPSQAAK